MGKLELKWNNNCFHQIQGTMSRFRCMFRCMFPNRDICRTHTIRQQDVDKMPKTINHRLSNAFGRLKGRWRSLLKQCDTNVEFLPVYIAACCVLHNMCQVHGDTFNDEWNIMDAEDSFPSLADSALSNATSRQTTNNSRSANTIRNTQFS